MYFLEFAECYFLPSAFLLVCRVSTCLPSALFRHSAYGVVCRVRDKMHSAKSGTLGKYGDSGSVRAGEGTRSDGRGAGGRPSVAGERMHCKFFK